jgi:hypothetical protein
VSRLRIGLLLVIPLTAACYHATITTGATPSTQVIEKPFAASWIYGLVPPSTVETMAKCPNGVAKVETQLSFVNMLVNAITFGLFTPMSIKVTCAAKAVGVTSGSAMIVAGTSPDSVRAAFGKAADQAVAGGKAVVVKMQ